jgi:hypothetical protein
VQRFRRSRRGHPPRTDQRRPLRRVPAQQPAGLEDDRDYVVKKLLEDGPSALETATSDELLRTFAIAGTPEEAREQLAELDGVLPHIVLHPPNVLPLNRADSEEAFRAIIRTFTL